VCWSLAQLRVRPAPAWAAALLTDGLEAAGSGLCAQSSAQLMHALARWRLPELREGGKHRCVCVYLCVCVCVRVCTRGQFGTPRPPPPIYASTQCPDSLHSPLPGCISLPRSTLTAAAGALQAAAAALLVCSAAAAATLLAATAGAAVVGARAARQLPQPPVGECLLGCRHSKAAGCVSDTTISAAKRRAAACVGDWPYAAGAATACTSGAVARRCSGAAPV
jgi:hypothetical protein